MDEHAASQHEGVAQDEHAAQSPSRRSRKALRRLGLSALILLLVALIFTAGNLASSLHVVELGNLIGLKDSLSQGASSTDEEVPAAQLVARLDEVAACLDGDALYRYTQGDLDAATTEAIRALIKTSGDPYAQYYTPEEYAEYLRGSEGEYSGIGVVLALMDEEITVLQVYEESPASEAGVLAGDVLLSIDGDAHDWELSEATEAIRRSLGEEITLVWRRGSTERETTLILREVNIPTIVSHLLERQGQSVGYVYLRRFNARSASELGEVLRILEDKGVQSFILDLRGNPGGYLTQAIGITSLFVPEGVVVQIQDRKGIILEKVDGRVVTNKPLIVIANGGSASASELVAAALQDHGRARVVGEVTYGKGTVQDIRELSWGGALKYTIAHYLSPDGRALDGVGVTPDILAQPAEDSEELGLTDHITNDNYRYAEGVDPQLDAALAALLDASSQGRASQDGTP
jgi:carboxyl-terminal processing protease